MIRPLSYQDSSRRFENKWLLRQCGYLRGKYEMRIWSGSLDCPQPGLGGLALDLDLDMASGLCQELHEHVDTEAINLAANQVTDSRLLDTK